MDKEIVKPLVSILMPAYNQEKYVSEAIESVLKSTYDNWELIIVDDGSPDNVSSIVRKYTESDKRIRFFHTPNRGVSAARNFAVSKANGEYLLPLDADDKIANTYIQQSIEIFLRFPETRLVYCKWKYFGTCSHAPKLCYKGYGKLLINNSIFNSAIFRKDDFERIKGYDEDIPFGLEDWEMWIRLLDEDAIVVQIDSPLFYYRRVKMSRSKKAACPDRERITLDYIYQKHKSIYNIYYPQSLILLKEYYHLKRRTEKWERRSVLGRLWYALLRRF